MVEAKNAAKLELATCFENFYCDLWVSDSKLHDMC